MNNVVEGSLLWKPSAKVIEQANLTHYMTWLKENRGLDFELYSDLWRWSVMEIEAFWSSLWDFFDIVASEPYATVLTERKMPGAKWFGGAKLNYAENIWVMAYDKVRYLLDTAWGRSLKMTDVPRHK